MWQTPIPSPHATLGKIYLPTFLGAVGTPAARLLSISQSWPPLAIALISICVWHNLVRSLA